MRKRSDHPAPEQQHETLLPGEEPEVKQPSRLRLFLARAGLAVLVAVAVVFAYVFLLLGEPDEDAKYMQKIPEEQIAMPMSALEVPGEANVQTMADAFGQPVLSMGQSLVMQKARIYDTAFENGYARRVTLTYAFEDGALLTAESIRPTSAVTLLKEEGYKLDASALYTLGGLNAARMDNETTCCVFAQSETAVYAVICPKDKAQDLTGILRYTMLIAPAAGE